MVFSKYVDYTVNSPNYSSRNGVKPFRIQIHHTATTNGDWVVDAMATGSKEVSANVVVLADGRSVGVVPEEYSAWTSGAAQFDRESLTFEIVNNSTDGWTISDATYNEVARVMSDWSIRYDIPLVHDLVHVIGHREIYPTYGVSYQTACPGGINVDYLCTLANKYKNNTATAPTEGEEMSFELKRNSQGTIEFRDEFGTENLGAYGTGLSNADLIAAANATWGVEQIPDRAFDVSRQINNRRAATYRAALLEDVVKAISPSITQAVQAAIANATIEAAPIDYAALAKAVNDDAAKRLGE